MNNTPRTGRTGGRAAWVGTPLDRLVQLLSPDVVLTL